MKNIFNRIKYMFRDYYIYYADIAELLNKAEEVVSPLPNGLDIVKLTKDNKGLYKCRWNVNKMLSVDGDVWAVVDRNTDIVAWNYGTYRDNDSMFFSVKNCDFESIEIYVDEKFRRKGVAFHLLYHTIKELNPEKIKIGRVATCIRPDNISSIKLHELIGYKRSRRVRLIHIAKIRDGRFTYINFPHYTI